MHLSVHDISVEFILGFKKYVIISIACVTGHDFGISFLHLCVILIYDGYIACPFLMGLYCQSKFYYWYYYPNIFLYVSQGSITGKYSLMSFSTLLYIFRFRPFSEWWSIFLIYRIDWRFPAISNQDIISCDTSIYFNLVIMPYRNIY